MGIVDVSGLTYRYGRVTALRDLDLSVAQGAVYALLGPNGSGKTTLLQILLGLRRAQKGSVRVFGKNVAALTVADRARTGYIAEGQPLPGWMRIEQLEEFLAPLYPTWDRALARDLRDRFDLDPARQVQTLSRGEHMKAALLCALAPRPSLLVMDEPFTGMDAMVKDELVRGLLESAGSEGWTVLLCSHDIGELELLADWVGVLDEGRLKVSEPMDALHARFKHVEMRGAAVGTASIPPEWIAFERAGDLVSFIVTNAGDALPRTLAERFPSAQIDVREMTLREIFVALARKSTRRQQEAAA
jgi:ABC-2 type transport system ATP-binding protein